VPAPLRSYPAGDVRILLAEAKKLGLSFEEAWETVVRPGRRGRGRGAVVTTRTPLAKRPELCVIWPGDTGDRNAWREAVEETKDAWRRAYLGEPPSRLELALSVLCGVIDDGESRLPVRYQAGRVNHEQARSTVPAP
jgi:hypothetical protein